MALLENIQNIIKEFKVEVGAFKGFLGIVNGKNIKFKEDVTPEQFYKVFDRMRELLGEPTCVHTLYGFTWEYGDEIVTLGSVEESYKCYITEIFILNKIPTGARFKYDEYTRIVNTVKSVLAAHGMKSIDYIHYNENKFLFCGVNRKGDCVIIINQRSLEFYYSANEQLNDGVTRATPGYSRKAKISLNDLSTIRQALEKCF